MQPTHHQRIQTALAVLLATQLILLPCLWWPVHTHLYHQQDTAVSRPISDNSQHPQRLEQQKACSWCDLYAHQSYVPFDQPTYFVGLTAFAVIYGSDSRDCPVDQTVISTPRAPPALW